jgi:hypothetical protein
MIIPPLISLILSIYSAMEGLEFYPFSNFSPPNETRSLPRITEDDSLWRVSLFLVKSLILPAISLPKPVPFEVCS